MDGGYDAGYKSCLYFWGKEPGSLVSRLAEEVIDFTKLSVLDAGCGDGKNAAYFGSRGAYVRGIDISSYAIANAHKEWEYCANITWEERDIRTLNLPESTYDIVVAYGLLHCLGTSGEIRETIYKLQNATKIGCYNIVCAFNNRCQDLGAHPGFRPCLVDHSFFANLYSTWQLIVCTDTDLTETHPHNNIPHTHSMTRILARRLK